MGGDDPVAARRLDGWKSIAGYFRRDRTTVMRWARDRGLPVRRMPGGKQGSIFALESELAGWALRQDDVSVPPPSAPVTPVPDTVVPSVPVLPTAPPRTGARRYVVAVVAIALVMAAVTAWTWRDGLRAGIVRDPPKALSLPRDPAVARDYIAARDAWARRTPADLEHAIALYAGVLRRDPTFTPAHVGMADAWLILREYGGATDATAYRNARRHAQIALRLDPRLPGAHRAMGFIDYWWDGRPVSAAARFRRAIALDDRDAQTHFWFANMLADIGQDAAAQAQYDKARLLDPGSRVIAVEQACSHWQAGRDALALAQLTALAAAAPGDATIQNCLAWVHIARGDIAGFAEAFGRRARLRREPRMMRFADELDAAVVRDPGGAVRVLVAQGRREIAAGERQLRETPAFYASAMGDRPLLVRLLVEANDLGERWPSVPVTRRIAARWRDDSQIQRLLRNVAVARD